VRAERISVQTSNGTIRGRVVDAPHAGSRVAEYLGIPFAQPPLGDLRYADPVPLDTLPAGNAQFTRQDGPVCVRRVRRCELSRSDSPTSAFCVGVRPAVAPAVPAPPDTLRR